MKTMEEFDQMLKEDDIKLSNEINKLMKIRHLMCTMEVSLYHKQLECNGKNNESER